MDSYDDCQFARLDWAARRGSGPGRKGKGLGERRWSAGEILREAARAKGHCAHVPNPQRPTILYGVEPLAVEAIALAWADSVRQKNGAALRQDSPVLACGVISLPRERLGDWPVFRAAAIDLLRFMLGARLRSVVEHLDEVNPHLHYYAVPEPGEDFGVVHPGYAAAANARSNGEDKRAAYTAAMREWLDFIHDKLGARFGLARIGPQRQRISRQKWKLQHLERVAIDAQARRCMAERDAARLRRQTEEEVEACLAEAARILKAVEEERERLAKAVALLGQHGLAQSNVLQQLNAQQRRISNLKAECAQVEPQWESEREERARLERERDARQDQQTLSVLQQLAESLEATGDTQHLQKNGTAERAGARAKARL